jgi:hypothetical protein
MKLKSKLNKFLKGCVVQINRNITYIYIYYNDLKYFSCDEYLTVAYPSKIMHSFVFNKRVCHYTLRMLALISATEVNTIWTNRKKRITLI